MTMKTPAQDRVLVAYDVAQQGGSKKLVEEVLGRKVPTKRRHMMAFLLGLMKLKPRRMIPLRTPVFFSTYSTVVMLDDTGDYTEAHGFIGSHGEAIDVTDVVGEDFEAALVPYSVFSPIRREDRSPARIYRDYFYYLGSFDHVEIAPSSRYPGAYHVMAVGFPETEGDESTTTTYWVDNLHKATAQALVDLITRRRSR